LRVNAEHNLRKMPADAVRRIKLPATRMGLRASNESVLKGVRSFRCLAAFLGLAWMILASPPPWFREGR